MLLASRGVRTHPLLRHQLPVDEPPTSLGGCLEGDVVVLNVVAGRRVRHWIPLDRLTS